MKLYGVDWNIWNTTLRFPPLSSQHEHYIMVVYIPVSCKWEITAEVAEMSVLCTLRTKMDGIPCFITNYQNSYATRGKRVRPVCWVLQSETLAGWKALQTNLCHNLFQIFKHVICRVSKFSLWHVRTAWCCIFTECSWNQLHVFKAL